MHIGAIHKHADHEALAVEIFFLEGLFDGADHAVGRCYISGCVVGEYSFGYAEKRGQRKPKTEHNYYEQPVEKVELLGKYNHQYCYDCKYCERADQ
jgi:hypothetical protein